MKIQNLSKTYDNKIVIQDLSYEFQEGITCIMGPSGCGKTTLLNILCGILAPDGGLIQTPARISVVWQEDRLLPWLSIYDNVMLGADPAQRDKCRALAEEIEILDTLEKHPSQLSAGQRQRAAILRALLFDGDAYLMDEPFNYVDTKTKARLMGCVLRELRSKRGIIVTHSIEEAEAVKGCILTASGPPLVFN